MQQTEHYKLNLIETTDPFSPAPLNENAEKTEAALAQASEAADALAGRVTVLEAGHTRIAAGTYTGNHETLVVQLGFTPKAVIVPTTQVAAAVITPECAFRDSACNFNNVEIIEGGFQIVHDNHISNNTANKLYPFIAFG